MSRHDMPGTCMPMRPTSFISNVHPERDVTGKVGGLHGGGIVTGISATRNFVAIGTPPALDCAHGHDGDPQCPPIGGRPGTSAVVVSGRTSFVLSSLTA